jgi:ParB/RepB/Spo0J family partition protein
MFKMSDTALANDAKLPVPSLPLVNVFIDHKFNCRGRVSPLDCIDLARDISARGLYQPITVRELRAETRGSLMAEIELLEKGFKWKILAGHKRFMAYKTLEAEAIPAIVMDGYMTDFEERDINALENLQRTELNMEQECNAIRHYWVAGWTRQEIAEKISKSSGWVQIRVMLLEMPDEVRQLAGQGLLTNVEVREIYKQFSPTEQIKFAFLIRDKKKRNDGTKVSVRIKKKDKPMTKKHRGRRQIFDVLEMVQTVLQSADHDKILAVGDIVSLQGNSFATKCLAWCAGEITTFAFHAELKNFAKTCGITYNMPEFDGSIELV